MKEDIKGSVWDKLNSRCLLDIKWRSQVDRPKREETQGCSLGAGRGRRTTEETEGWEMELEMESVVSWKQMKKAAESNKMRTVELAM